MESVEPLSPTTPEPRPPLVAPTRVFAEPTGGQPGQAFGEGRRMPRAKQTARLRIRLDCPDHPKIERLCRRFGTDAPFRCLIRLWTWAAEKRPDGRLSDMDVADVEFASRWPGGRGDFVGALLECRLLDETDGIFAIHNWIQEQPYLSNSRARSEAASRAARVRWGCGPDAEGNAKRMCT